MTPGDVVAIYIPLAVGVGMLAMYEDLPAGEAVAAGVFWPIVVPIWLLINLARLGNRAWWSLDQ